MQRLVNSLSSAFDISHLFVGRKLAIFFDYDGVLTPIVRRPAEAILSSKMRNTLKELVKIFFTAVISGRDLQNIRDLVQLDELYYAGNHGFEMAGPNSFHFTHQGVEAKLLHFDGLRHEFEKSIQNIQGAWVETKRFGISVHFREVAQADVRHVKDAVKKVARGYLCLRLMSGKKIWEFLPDIEWDKGRAISHLVNTLNLDMKKVMPIFFGDDMTDEAGFCEVAKVGGIGVIVGRPERKTFARYYLEDQGQVREFLEQIIK